MQYSHYFNPLLKVIHPKYYKHLKTGVHQMHLAHKIEPLHGTFDPMHQFWYFLEVNAFIWSTMKVQFIENIYDMYQCPPNPGFTSIKVQNGDFLKKPSVDNIFFSSIMFS